MPIWSVALNSGKYLPKARPIIMAIAIQSASSLLTQFSVFGFSLQATFFTYEQNALSKASLAKTFTSSLVSASTTPNMR